VLLACFKELIYTILLLLYHFYFHPALTGDQQSSDHPKDKPADVRLKCYSAHIWSSQGQHPAE
jgi:hypothetical protein